VRRAVIPLWLSVPLTAARVPASRFAGRGRWRGGTGAGLKGACPAEPSIAALVPPLPFIVASDEGGRVEKAVGGIDPHKHSITVGLVDGFGADIAVMSFANTGDGLRHALQWLADRSVEIVRVGIEGSAGHGRHVAERLAAAGYDIREVPTRRTAERRRARRRAKNDHEDALAIAQATAGEPGLGPVKQPGRDDVLEELAAVRRHRDMLVQRRTMMLNHAEAVLVALPRPIADALPRGRAVAPRLAAAVTIDTTSMPPAVRSDLDLLRELVEDIAVISERVKTLERRLGQLVESSGSTLTQEAGIGVVAAASLLVEIGNPQRFRTESAFNRWWGGAPVAVSSGEGDGQPLRHRLDRLGNRSVNSTLHIMSVTQSRCHQPAKDYLARKRGEGASAREARRAHKTHLGRRVIRRMWADQHRAPATAREPGSTALLAA
jgi:transposase